ncbi:MAG: alpha-2-macroglobulin family protein, partial [Chitinophagaceae bacterium]
MRIKQVFAIAILLLSVIGSSYAQQNEDYYVTRWKKIDTLQQKGLTRSALDIVEEIYAVSKKEKNDVQMIRALQFRMAIRAYAEENSFGKELEKLEQEAAALNESSRSILYSMAAQLYWIYLQGARYRLYDQTKTINFKKEDIATWGVEDLHRKIAALYLLSMDNKELLQQTKVDAYEPLMMLAGSARHLRPTLYDLLAHRALEYFGNDERYITRPGYAFELSAPEAFAEPAIFAKNQFINKDSLSHVYNALTIYQQLTAFHLKDTKPDALIDLEIQRLAFAYNKTVLENKDALYESALQSIVDKYPSNKESANALYAIARLHKEKADRYRPLKDTAYRYELVTVKNICEKVRSMPDSSEGKSMCTMLLNEILQKELSLQTEKVNITGQPFRTLVSYRNISQLHLRLVPVSSHIKHNLLPESSDAYWNRVMRSKPIRSYIQPLPDAKDYRAHTVEVKIDALPSGKYALIAGSDENFYGKNGISVVSFYVSGIAYINNGKDFFVLNRETGEPLANARIQVWNNQFDPNKRDWGYRKRERLKSDHNGYFRINRKGNEVYNEIHLDISAGTDHILMEEEDNEDISEGYEPDDISTGEDYKDSEQYSYLFTDRSIYRPGQVVYFKGIAITKDPETRKSKIIAGKKTTVFLYDANTQPIDSMEVTTNEFGSFSGKFRLPQNQLNGQFTIEEKGQVSFRVEEYKRPKFYAGYENPTGSYRINDTIVVTGFAKAFAGNNIDGATVKYRVVRRARFPYSWRFWQWSYPDVSQQEITHGEIQTGTDGKFKVRFAAIPDLSIKKEFDPVFDYEVSADVTDVNGETRSATTYISVSYKALQLVVNFPYQTLPADSFKTIPVTTTNMAGSFEPALVRVVMHRLQTPQRTIRKRYWERPDQFIMSQSEYLQSFPYDEYSNETKKETWQKLEKVFDKSDSTQHHPDSTRENFQPPTLKAGWYVIEFTTHDKYGESIKDIRYVELTAKNRMPVILSYEWDLTTNITAEPGETANVEIGSSAKDVHIIQVTDKDPERLSNSEKASNKYINHQYSFITINNQKISIPFAVTEEDRGDFFVVHAFVKHNRFYTSTTTINVPWSNKDLSISYETFRDKTLPGSQEKWKVKLTGYKKEKVAAEMLTAMYDASLDQFDGHGWSLPDIWDTYGSSVSWRESSFQSNESTERKDDEIPTAYISDFRNSYDELVIGYRIINNADGSFRAIGGYNNLYGLVGQPRTLQVPDWNSDPDGSKALMKDTIYVEENGLFKPSPGLGAYYMNLDKEHGATQIVFDQRPPDNQEPPPVQVRKNFNETVFFLPELKTDSAGDIEFSFTMPDALTQWKWMMLSHTKDLAMGYSEKSIIAQKELMVQPNIPRFLREGDRIDLSAKVVNMSDQEIKGDVSMQFIDATTNQPISGWLKSIRFNNFTVGAGQSTPVKFTAQIPYGFNGPVSVRFIAQSGNISDGEENTVPVLTNRMMVTESLPLNVKGEDTKNFRFEKLLQSDKHKTLAHHALTLEFTSNPAWYAVQSLPYLMEFPYECSEQLWNRVYANTLAAKIINASPRIKEVFEKWRSDTTEMLSGLQKNEELKSVLLQETPWVLDAKNESQQKKNLALLFDLVKMGNELEKNLTRLKQRQLRSGAFSWFGSEYEDRYITQYILTGIGHLQKLDALPEEGKTLINEIAENGLRYLDNKIKEDYDYLVKSKRELKKDQLDYTQINYLYMRSFFTQVALPEASTPAYNYYLNQSRQFWLARSKYMQGMIALALHRTGDAKTPQDILRSLKENAIINDEKGMYWKEVTNGYYWYEAPIETQSLLIEAFADITKDHSTVDNLKTWLLRNKQTNSWSNTKATAEACYALLLQGSDWLSAEPLVQIKLGDKTVNSSDQKAEAGTGYFKKVFDAAAINNSMGDISVNITQTNNAATAKSANKTSWGAVYWQYFENMENITTASTPLKLSKKLFIERNTDRGPVLEPVEENSTLKVGDKIKVRIELRADRDMEYVHMKDMRASSLEPVNVISSYKWQGGLGYYESTKDASTNFFFNYLPKGTYVFEYPLFVTHTGTFSNGITTIQCMYAPEFSSHSEGIKI